MKYLPILAVLVSINAYAMDDDDWTAFDNSVHQIQGNVGKYYQRRMCDLKQPPLKPGEHGVVYHLKNGKCVGDLK